MGGLKSTSTLLYKGRRKKGKKKGIE